VETSDVAVAAAVGELGDLTGLRSYVDELTKIWVESTWSSRTTAV
jgi:hypothetical protein